MNLKSYYRRLLKISVRCFGVPFTKKLDARVRFGRKINLKNPVTLADKLCWLELYREDSLKIHCTDKYAVRKYIEKKGFSYILVPLLMEPVASIDQFDFEALPDSFVLKAADGCGMNYICADKKKADQKEVENLVGKWLREGYTRACIEPHYLRIPHRVICEQLLPDADHIIDYKFHCFHGKPDFILVCGNRVQNLQKRVYTTDWKPLDVVVGKEHSDHEFRKPDSLDEMLRISETLSADFDFVRVDLYNIKGKIYFGELTFTPASGVLPNFSEKFVEEKGKLLHIENVDIR